LSDLGDLLETCLAAIDFEMFRRDLEAALNSSYGAKGCRPPYDPVMMLKILIIQAQDNLADEAGRIPDQ
jgi:transposase